MIALALAILACLLAAVALIAAVRAVRVSEYAARQARGGRPRSGDLNLGPSRNAPPESRGGYPSSAEPTELPEVPSGPAPGAPRTDTREMRMPRPGQM